jgi:hypothetical protein
MRVSSKKQSYYSLMEISSRLTCLLRSSPSSIKEDVKIILNHVLLEALISRFSLISKIRGLTTTVISDKFCYKVSVITKQEIINIVFTIIVSINARLLWF